MGTVTYKQLADGGTWYNMSYGTITLYEDHLVWSQGVFSPTVTPIAYTDIISVSSSDGSFWNNAYIEVNTAGRAYSIKLTCKENGFNIVAQKIRDKVANAKKKASAPTATVSVADEILKFKQLADCGAISQEEYETKKRQLLDHPQETIRPLIDTNSKQMQSIQNDDDNPMYFEVTCPSCEKTFTIDKDVFNLVTIRCPKCGEIMEFEYDTDDC